jgi:hypothetical protein
VKRLVGGLFGAVFGAVFDDDEDEEEYTNHSEGDVWIRNGSIW